MEPSGLWDGLPVDDGPDAAAPADPEPDAMSARPPGPTVLTVAEVNRLGVDEEWEFNEWCHGRSGQPMGYPHQAWSAGMYLYASHCVSTKTVPLLSQSLKVQKKELEPFDASSIQASIK